MCNLGHIGVLTDEFIAVYYSDVCVYYQCPQTLAETHVCRTMGICCGVRAVATREKYPSFILSSPLNYTQWARNNNAITSKDVATSFWCYTDVIIASYVCWVAV